MDNNSNTQEEITDERLDVDRVDLMDRVKLEGSIGQMLEGTSLGNIDRVIGDNLYGINARGRNPALPRANNSQGYTFFTRPQLNLDDENVSSQPSFNGMLAANNMSYQKYVRMMLDPRLGASGYFKSPIVNNHQAFIPILTNTLTSLNGWPQLRPPQYTSPTGLYGDQISYTDGVPNFYEVFDLSATFENMRGNFHVYLFTIWVLYQTYVFEGIFNPYMDMIVNREIDYNTRIYRIITDFSNRYVTDIACTGAAFPVSVPVGDIFDYSRDEISKRSLKDINITFKAIGFLFNEDIIKLEFNQTQAIFNPSIRALLEHDFLSKSKELIRREDPSKLYDLGNFQSPGGFVNELVKVPYNSLATIQDGYMGYSHYRLNHFLYPYINLSTNELEWWAPRDMVSRLSRKE